MPKTVYGEKLYYTDEHNDDFAAISTPVQRKIDKTYKYKYKNIFLRFLGWFLYYFVAVPVFTIIGKLMYGVKICGRKNLKKVKGGAVVYSNHTHALEFLFTFVIGAFPKRCHIICDPAAVRIPFIAPLVKMLGGLPLPEDLDATKNFNKTVAKLLAKGDIVMVMPEAHIWPYTTIVRNYPDISFKYAVKNKVPAIPVTTTFSKHRGLFKNYRKPRFTITYGEPIYADEHLPISANAKIMRDHCYNFMVKTAAEKNECKLYDYVVGECDIPTHLQIKELKKRQKNERRILKKALREERRRAANEYYNNDAEFDDELKEETLYIE